MLIFPDSVKKMKRRRNKPDTWTWGVEAGGSGILMGQVEASLEYSVRMKQKTKT